MTSSSEERQSPLVGNLILWIAFLGLVLDDDPEDSSVATPANAPSE